MRIMSCERPKMAKERTASQISSFFIRTFMTCLLVFHGIHALHRLITNMNAFMVFPRVTYITLTVLGEGTSMNIYFVLCSPSPY
jgi:hypothetical protein